MLRPHHPARVRVTAALSIQCPVIMPLSKAKASGFDFVLIIESRGAGTFNATAQQQTRGSLRAVFFRTGGTCGACTEPRSIASICLITAATIPPSRDGPLGGTWPKLNSKHALRSHLIGLHQTNFLQDRHAQQTGGRAAIYAIAQRLPGVTVMSTIKSDAICSSANWSRASPPASGNCTRAVARNNFSPDIGALSQVVVSSSTFTCC